MEKRVWDWRPDREELERIMTEMRPIIRQFALRDRGLAAEALAR